MAVSEAHKKASNKWNSSRDNIMIRPSKEVGETIRAAAAAAGKSVQGYVLEAVREKMECEAAADDAGAGAVPAGSPVSEDGPGAVMVSEGGPPEENMCSQSSSLATPDFQAAVSSSGLTANEFIEKAVAKQVEQWRMSQVPEWLSELFPEETRPAIYIMKLPRYEQREIMKNWTPEQKEEFNKVLGREMSEKVAEDRKNGTGLFAQKPTCNIPLD